MKQLHLLWTMILVAVAAVWTPKCVFGQMQPEFFVFTK